MKSINDTGNGIIGAHGIHAYFDSRLAAVLKVRQHLFSSQSAYTSVQTPNPVLRTNDVPARHICNLPDGTSHPLRARYTLQALADDRFLCDYLTNNFDAAFVSQRKRKPSDLLLHYNYGAAAVKHWGRNTAVLDNRPGLYRPPAPETTPVGAAKRVGNRTERITKMTAEGIR